MKKNTLRRIELVFAEGAMNSTFHVEFLSQIMLADGVTPDPEEPPRTRRETVEALNLNAEVDIPGLGKTTLGKLIDKHHAEAVAVVTELVATVETLAHDHDELAAQVEALSNDREALTAQVETVTVERDSAQAEAAQLAEQLAAATEAGAEAGQG